MWGGDVNKSPNLRDAIYGWSTKNSEILGIILEHFDLTSGVNPLERFLALIACFFVIAFRINFTYNCSCLSYFMYILPQKNGFYLKDQTRVWCFSSQIFHFPVRGSLFKFVICLFYPQICYPNSTYYLKCRKLKILKIYI